MDRRAADADRPCGPRGRRHRLAIYVLAGTDDVGRPVGAIDRFDGESWSTVGDLPGDGLNAPSAATVGGLLYLIGGFGTVTNRPTDEVWAFDPADATWQPRAPLPVASGGHVAVEMDGLIHVLGGGTNRSTIADHLVYVVGGSTEYALGHAPRGVATVSRYEPACPG